jgi:hypothetical protein
MATVRLTKDLRTYILSKAKDQVRPAISRAEQQELDVDFDTLTSISTAAKFGI